MISIQGYAQKQGINYQAVILNPNTQEIPGVDAEGNLLANTIVGIQFIINDAFGDVEYQENHTTSTDMFGMINLLIGDGDHSYSSFSAIVWDGTPKKLQVAIDFKGGSNYVPLSSQDLTYMPSPVTQQTSQLIDSNTTSISEEVTRANAAEDANTTSISEEVTRATAAEDVNTTSISEEVTRAKSVEDANTTSILEEVIRAKSAEDVNTTSILEEVTRATAAEDVNTTSILEEVTRANAAEDVNTTSILEEVTRANAAEDVNTTSILEEVTRAKSAEDANTTSISEEVIRANAAEDLNTTSISEEVTRANAAEDVNTTSISEEVTRATAAEDVNTTSILEEVTRATAAEDANATAISEEVIRATAAEDANTTSISEEVTRATVAEGVNTTSISEEVIRATAADLEINTLADGTIYLGNVSNVASEVTLTGNVTIDNAGVSTIGASQVVSSMIADGTIVVGDLADDALETAKIKDLNVTTSKIADANVTNDKIATGIDAVKLADGSVDNSELQYIGTLTSDAQVQINALSTAGTTNNTNIAANATDIDALETLADGTIYLGDGTNQAVEVTMSGDVTMDNSGVSTIVEGAVVSSMIADGTIVVGDLADDALETAKIKDLNVTTSKIADANVTNDKIATGIDAVKLADGSVDNSELQYIGTLTSDAQVQINALSTAGTTNNTNIAANATDIDALETLADGTIYLGDGTNQAVEVTLSGEATIDNTGVVTLNNAAVIVKVLTGFTSGAGIISATDNILEAVQKLDGNNATNADLTGMVTSLGNATSLGSFTSANLSGAVTDETGTGSAVFATSPTLVTPVLGTPTVLVGTNITGIASGLTAGTATKLAVTKKINGVDFDGSLDITVTAVAETLTGTALNATVVGSSLTSVGTLGDLTVNGTVETVLVKITGGAPAVGKVLTSDEAGLASWAVAAVSVKEVGDEFTATASQTTFTLSQVPSANSIVKMYVNGIRISNTAYSWSGTTLTYISSNNGDYDITVSDRIQFDYFY